MPKTLDINLESLPIHALLSSSVVRPGPPLGMARGRLSGGEGTQMHGLTQAAEKHEKSSQTQGVNLPTEEPGD